jgi:hypothetical protein
MNILKDFFKKETPYPMKRMELLKYASKDRKQTILQQIMNRHNANELLKNRAIRLNDVKEMLFFYDDSLWGNAKGGILITVTAIYFRKYGDDTVSRLDWDEVTKFNGVHYNRNKITVAFNDRRKAKNRSLKYTIYADQEQGLFINNLFERIFKFKKTPVKKLENRKKDGEPAKRKIELEKKKSKALQEKNKIAAALKETELKNKKRREEQGKERKKKELELQKIIDEKNKNGYFIEDIKSATAKGPFKKDEIEKLFEEGIINFDTKLKKGIQSNTFKEILTFKEINTGFNQFL